MIDIALSAVANQSFFVQLDERAYAISIHTADDVLTASISRDDVTLITGARIAPGTPLLPYRYQESGNFVLLTQDDDMPEYSQLGVTQFLVYLSPSELASLRAA